MPGLFEIEGDDLDLDVGYRNLREGAYQTERQIVAALEAMWEQFEPYADEEFRQGFARDPESRFWEMFLACALLQAGKVLLPSKDRPKTGGRPDICVVEEGRRIWVEAIAPTKGEDPQDRIPDLVALNEGGHVRNQPKRQIQLRITSALWNKTRVVKRYLKSGTIRGDDIVVIAIGAAHLGIYAAGVGIPLALSSVFPIGDQYVTLSRESLEVLRGGYEHSFEIQRACGEISRTAFLDETFAPVSGLIWSRVSIGNMRRGERPLSFIHNPMAQTAMPQRWGIWDREFVAVRNEEGWGVSDILADGMACFDSIIPKARISPT